MAGHGDHGQLTAEEWERTASRNVERIEQAIADDEREAETQRDRKERAEAEVENATTGEERQRHRRDAEQAADFEDAAVHRAELRRREELEPALAEHREARIAHAGERSVAASRARARARRAFTPSTAENAARYEQALGRDDVELAAYRSEVGDETALPEGYVDDHADPPDLPRWIELLANGRRTRVEDAAEKTKAAERFRENARRDKRAWLKQQGLAFLKNPANVGGEDPELVEEVLAVLAEEQEATRERRQAAGTLHIGA